MIDHILIEESVRYHPMTEKAIEAQIVAQDYLPKTEIIADKDSAAVAKHLGQENPYARGKRVLVLKSARGEQFKTCPGTDGVVCCNYYVFNFLSGCPLNCSYCYLGAYLNQPALSLQVNLEEPLADLVERFEREPKRLFRIGTGEIADSLALPASDPVNRYLIRKLSPLANVMLEFKTKSARVAPLLNLDPQRRTMISWSLSPPAISSKEEHGTATIGERLLAAKSALQAGYQVAFHLDPLMFAHDSWDSWEKDYTDLLTMVFDHIRPENISWISVGALRLMKGLREHMVRHFPTSILPYQEMVPGSDGKLRYPKPTRKRMFQFISQKINTLAAAQAPAVYLCMESREVWNKALGGTPDANGKLRPLFNSALPPRPIQLSADSG